MAYFLFGVVLAGFLLLLMQWWANAEVASAKRTLTWAIAGVCLLLGLILLATGKAFLAAVPAGYAVLRMVGPLAAGKLFQYFRAGRAGKNQASQSNNQMSKSEALEILGLENGASTSEINEAYRRLMSQVHPDKGGSDWMAVKLNAARKTLLGK